MSGVVVYSQKALDILKAANVHLTEHPFEIVAEGQMKTSPAYQQWFDKVMDSLKNPSENIDDALAIIDHIHKVERWKNRFKHPLRTIYHVLKKI